jgi:predicted transcriptional regulator
MPKKKREIRVSPGEKELLDILWEIGGGTISQVHKLHQARGNSVAYGTIQTRLNRLVEKGAAHRVGFPGEYRAAIQPEDVTDGYYDTIAKFCGASIVPLMSHLAAKRPFDDDEIALLEQIVAMHRKERNRKGEP